MLEANTYQDLKIWQLAMDLAITVIRVSEYLPKPEGEGLGTQIKAAAIEMPAAIADGWSRHRDVDFIHALKGANGTVRRVETYLLLAVKLNMLTAEAVEKLVEQAESLAQKIQASIYGLEKVREEARQGERGSEERRPSGGGFRGREEGGDRGGFRPGGGGGFRGREDRGDRPSYGGGGGGGFRGRDDRGGGGFRGGDRPARPFGDRPQGGGFGDRNGGGRSFGDRPQGGGFRGRDDRGGGGFGGDRPAFGGDRGGNDRGGDRGGFGGDRPAFGGDRGGDRNGGGRPPFGDRNSGGDRPSYGGDRPKPFGDRPKPPFGGGPKRGFRGRRID